ncbi:type II toxin-antitoxin system Phd/YefM family antitoxin [Candidatus Peregrinibacteria bacterium]|nr:type II toxin-antitoxin system Phd/YefM family antitoxin [Candidatus Peregrinibacteria bacterium]
MFSAGVLAKEKIISLSQLQKNPAKALDGKIVRITKNGQEIGIYMSKEEFEDFLEESMALKSSFKDELADALKKAKVSKNHKKLEDIL